MKMLENSQATFLNETEFPLMSSQAVSHAKTFQLPAASQELAKAQEADCGPKSCDLLASYDQATSSWRTLQTCLVAQAKNEAGGLAEYSETWPSAGMMRNGKTFQRQPWALPIVEKESGLLPTPSKSDPMLERRAATAKAPHVTRNGTVRNGPSNLGFPATVRYIFLPTLGKNEPKGASSKRFRGSEHFRGAKMSEGLRICETDPTYLHPSFAEAAMGFPIGWTELEPVGTQSFHKSQNS